MRCFKSKVLLAWTWVAPALSAALPPGHEPSLLKPEGKLLSLDLQESYAQATFSVPCAGCLGEGHTSHDDESLILSFKTDAIEQPCGTSNITLNGAHLPQEWTGDFASGSGSYAGVTHFQENAHSLQRSLDVEWESACLYNNQENSDAAQVLTVKVKSVDGKLLDTPSGFTISFKQLSPPELLRLERIPNPSASGKEQAESWRAPPSHLRLVPAAVDAVQAEEHQTSDASTQSSLEVNIRELRALQAEVQDLQKEIEDKKQYIKAHFKEEAKKFEEELNECEGISCVVKGIANKANGAWKTIWIKIRPDRHHHEGSSALMGHPDKDPYARVWRTGNKQAPQAESHKDLPLPPRPQASAYRPSPSPSVESSSSSEDAPRRSPQEYPVVIALEVLLGLLCCGCLLKVVRHYCSSLRSRTERAAAREERLNAQAYRRAARKLRWRNWWRGNWRDHARIEDYEEKRSLIQEQEGLLEGAMQEEIRQLRAAHDVVADLVRAEEGRVNSGRAAHTHCHCHSHSNSNPVPVAPYSPLSTASTYPPTSLPELPSRPLSRTDSLPGYRSDTSSAGSPPAYEEEEPEPDMSEVVVNGFSRYTPSSASSARWRTPDSSVVDVSPRPSAETLRFAEGADTGVGGEKN
ncbi:hypothetical protein BDV95DRAFT_496084 [Massariosphaeria phaeospora]|uniref:Uncharacterized protein n=1 Tax=Massariosphaeria phaeospora TaxID=100035 RepID=A0A7C8I4Q7_9PLEO|nr:hypothetical protein BDV95DRAFT_496084 [Massariosphaeria phaeospora]